MKDKLQKFDNIFNCPKCNKTLWQYSILKDGTKLCPNCYKEYTKVENEKASKNQAYIESKSKELINKGLSDLIFNFFEKKYSDNQAEEELKKLWKLFKLKYNLEIEYDSFFKIISSIYESSREEKELETFEQDLMQEMPHESPPESPHVDISNYQCDICKSQIDKETYEFSNKIFNKGLCLNHQGAKHPRNLFIALKKRGVPCEFEVYDGYKYVDIAIHDIKLYIEVGETLNSTDPKQFLDDLKKDRFSNLGGYQTRRINFESIDKYLDEIADTLKDIYNKVKNS